MRTITAPGVEIKEIDKSQYSPAMTGTACYVLGFSTKGEPYIPMEFTSRTAFTTFYGEPDNEAERYFYAAACEVLNQNGRLFTARLPYDNESFGKMIAHKYTLGSTPVALSAAGFSEITFEDETVKNALKIEASSAPSKIELTEVDGYRTEELSVANDKFVIVDKTCGTYKRIVEDTRKGWKREMLGIVPVVTTAANALYAQKLINVENYNAKNYETIDRVVTQELSNDSLMFDKADLVRQLNSNGKYVELTSGEWIPEDGDDTLPNTVSFEANTFFPTIEWNTDTNSFVRDELKKIGVVVYKTYLDPSEGNKIQFEPVEAFAGSLDKYAKNPSGSSAFIDRIINSQSNYIYFFSNCTKTMQANEDAADILINSQGIAPSLGFYSQQTEEKISLAKSIYQGMNTAFDKNNDILVRDIDIVCDAGIANIASYIKASGADSTTPMAYDLTDTSVMGAWKADNKDQIKVWKTVEQKFDNFCKNIRKDCMFIADGPRPLVIQGQKKIIRESKPTNTFDVNILPNIKFITGLNTNYGAGYMNWFEQADDYSGDFFWCPPSIKAMGVYINTDVNFQYWDAPAGLNRGVIAASDVSFSPNSKQAGAIYEKNWNYAINYPNDGIVLEGQKTFQVKPSAFDRVNVRRLFLRLERAAFKVSRYFVYEGNTAYTRQRLVDALDPYFKEAKIKGGIYDYKIICDETVNTPDVIDRNELQVKIGIKPVKTAEFIILSFIAVSTGGSFEEAMG